MNQSFILLSEIIKNRRSVYPQQFKPGQIDDQLLEQILENARWSPTHKNTEPWRFHILKEGALLRLANFLGDFYVRNTTKEGFSETKMLKASEKPRQAACVIAICIQRSPESVIPAWEETAALACAVQNIWLSASSLGIGSYWSTPNAIKEMSKFLGLQMDQECLGIFYMGWKKEDLLFYPKRKPLSEIMSIIKL